MPATLTNPGRPRSTVKRSTGIGVPSEAWRRLARDAAPPAAPPKGLDAAWYAAGGWMRRQARRTSSYLRLAKKVAARRRETEKLSEIELREQLGELRWRFRRGRQARADVLEALVLLRETAVRSLGLRPHPVQIAASLVIHDGGVGEMATGEGKTLSTALAAIIAGWRGRGCHVMTFNGYLAARDAEDMLPLFAACGLRVGHVEDEMDPADRRVAYAADVTYCTSQQVAADFLRDKLAMGRHVRPVAALLSDLTGSGGGASELLLRGLETAIIDEADAILIDDAVTPLIISGEAPNAEQVDAYQMAAWTVRGLERGVDYSVDERYRQVRLTDRGREQVDDLLGPVGGLWLAPRRRNELVTQALAARELFLRDKQYVVDDRKIVIVDESTGRLMPDRTWRAGMHQAMEAKEGLPVNPPKETMARISFQRFFRMYRCLGGTSGTIREARRELWGVYGLPVVVLPTHRKCRRRMLGDRIFATGAQRWAAVLQEIRSVHAEGRPVLVGTRSVEASERLGRELAAAGIEHQILNAVRHAEEARIVAGAGEAGRITVATNMAGRGTDIKLGRGVAERGGLHVIATERHESPRVDRQLFGRAARQGDPGSAVAFASLDDELCRRYASPALRALARRDPSGSAGRLVITGAQRRAERAACRQRREVLRGDDWLERYLGFAGRAR